MRTSKTTLLALLCGPLLAAGATADTIHKTDGKSIEDVTVVEETLQEVTFKKGNSRSSVQTDQVLRIDHTGKPKLVDRADLAVQDDQILDAIDDYGTYLGGYLAGNGKERYRWAPAYAAARLVQLKGTVGDHQGVVLEADRLVQQFSNSRFVPDAYLAKADALVALGKPREAKVAIDALTGLVAEKGLSRRWGLEADLASVVVDTTLKGERRAEAFKKVAGQAGTEFPSVRNRAEARRGEVLLERKDFSGASKLFERLTADPKSDDESLAISYTGLGDCLYQQAAGAGGGADAATLYQRSLLAYMRVVVLYKDQSAYVPRAMFFSGRCLDQIGDEDSKEKAGKLYSAVVRQYPGSKWADEAKGFR